MTKFAVKYVFNTKRRAAIFVTHTEVCSFRLQLCGPLGPAENIDHCCLFFFFKVSLKTIVLTILSFGGGKFLQIWLEDNFFREFF